MFFTGARQGGSQSRYLFARWEVEELLQSESPKNVGCIRTPELVRRGKLSCQSDLEN